LVDLFDFGKKKNYFIKIDNLLFLFLIVGFTIWTHLFFWNGRVFYLGGD